MSSIEFKWLNVCLNLFISLNKQVYVFNCDASEVI